MSMQTIRIVVVDRKETASGSAEQTSASGGTTNAGKQSGIRNGGILNINQKVRSFMETNLSPATMFAVQQGVSLVKQVGREVISYYVSDIGRANGDSNYQDIVNRQIEIATDGLSIFQGAINGISMGSAAGPLGMLIGGVSGAAFSGVGLGFKYAERQRAYAHEMFLQSNSQAYQLARANYTALTGRVR